MPQTISVALITKNEEHNLARTLASVQWANEIIVVDSGSADKTEEIAREYGARFFVKPWEGFAAQKNAALAKCNSDWILSLDADEEVSRELQLSIQAAIYESYARYSDAVAMNAHQIYLFDCKADLAQHFNAQDPGEVEALYLDRRNLFLGRWIKRGGYYPDSKLRLIRRGAAEFAPTPVHETLQFSGKSGRLRGDLIHHAYPTLTSYIEHMDRYSTLGADAAIAKGRTSRNAFAFVFNVIANPVATFLYNYFFRLGFLDGREGLLLHLYHSAYVSWKYAKAWERSR